MMLTRVSELILLFLNLWLFIYSIICSISMVEVVSFVRRVSYVMVTEFTQQVWVAKEETRKKLEDIPIPSSDVKNLLESVDFEDELTQSRCRGWLVLPPRRYLQADILFPGCKFDCRFTVRGQTGAVFK